MDWAPKCASWPFAPMIKSRTMASKFKINHFLQPKHEGIAWSCCCCCERKCSKLGLMLQVHWLGIICFVHLQCKADNLSLAGITEPLRRINQGWPHQAFNIATDDCKDWLQSQVGWALTDAWPPPVLCAILMLMQVAKVCKNCVMSTRLRPQVMKVAKVLGPRHGWIMIKGIGSSLALFSFVFIFCFLNSSASDTWTGRLCRAFMHGVPPSHLHCRLDTFLECPEVVFVSWDSSADHPITRFARKMMPNPKSGTVVPNLKAAIKEVTAGWRLT